MDNRTRLLESLTKLAGGGLCVAFSGGVDSAVVLKAACRAAPGRVHAVTLYTPFHSPLERDEARQQALSYGAAHTVLELADMPREVLDNPPDRCYLCKGAIFREIWKYARVHGLAHVLDGTNADDLGQYRPGLRALKELEVKSPLAELGLTKAQVRQVAADMGLAVASKPSAPCLATRFPYDTPIDMALLPGVERIEDAVKALGPQVVRARIHGDTVRLEVPPADFAAVLAGREAVLESVKAAGFTRLTLDLEGYRSGTFDGPYRDA